MPDAPFSPHLPPRRKDVGTTTEPDARIEPVTRDWRRSEGRRSEGRRSEGWRSEWWRSREG
jgi:hypothetical protein